MPDTRWDHKRYIIEALASLRNNSLSVYEIKVYTGLSNRDKGDGYVEKLINELLQDGYIIVDPNSSPMDLKYFLLSYGEFYTNQGIKGKDDSITNEETDSEPQARPITVEDAQKILNSGAEIPEEHFLPDIQALQESLEFVSKYNGELIKELADAKETIELYKGSLRLEQAQCEKRDVELYELKFKLANSANVHIPLLCGILAQVPEREVLVRDEFFAITNPAMTVVCWYDSAERGTWYRFSPDGRP